MAKYERDDMQMQAIISMKLHILNFNHKNYYNCWNKWKEAEKKSTEHTFSGMFALLLSLDF